MEVKSATIPECIELLGEGMKKAGWSLQFVALLAADSVCVDGSDPVTGAVEDLEAAVENFQAAIEILKAGRGEGKKAA